MISTYVLRKFTFYLTVLLAVVSAEDALSQQPMAKGQLNDSVGLKDFLDNLEQRYAYNFIYEPAVLRSRYVEADISDVSDHNVEKKLVELLSPLNLSIQKIADKTFVIKQSVSEPRETVTRAAVVFPVTGTVRSKEDDMALPGVNVTIKGTSVGTVTDANGQFSLEVPAKGAVLVFSFIGFQPMEVTVGNQTTINVELLPDVLQLSEVVVTAVGIEANKHDLGYSVQNISSEEITGAHETNLSNALSGKAAGVQVISSSGSPGASATVRIRGSRSLSANNEPLYVVDGLPINNNTSGNGLAGVDVSNRAIDINPSDIESITVLKGPAATVLYGSRAANGAIMITTKKGKQGKPVITFNTSFGLNNVNKLPAKQRKYAQGRPSGGVLTYRGPELGETLSWGPAISELEFDGDPTYLYDQHGALVAAGTGDGTPAKAYDDYDAFWITGQTYDNSLSVSGGTEAVKYYVSVGDLYQTGNVPNADFRRTSTKTNLDFELSPKLKVGVTASYIKSGGNRIQRGSNLSGVTAGLFRNPTTFDIGNGKKGQEAADDPDTYVFADGTQRRATTSYDNPFWVTNKTPYKDDVNRFIGGLNLTYDLLPWLKLNYKVGQDYFSDVRHAAWDINSSSEVLGEVDQSARDASRFNSDFLILINKSLTANWNLDATLGHNYFSDHIGLQQTEGVGLSIPGFYNIKNASTVTTTEEITRRKFYGVFADVRLNYKEFLYLDFSGRNDWSSTLANGNNDVFYPAASAALDVTRLLDMLDHPILSYSKLRLSYGQVGTSPPPYRTSTSWDNAVVDGDDLLAASNFPAFDLNAFERGTLKGNKNLKPELTTTLEVGGDFSFLQGRIDLDVTYYNAFTNNQIVTTDIPAGTGYTTITLNSGRIENRGWEVTLSGTPVKKGRFTWETSVNYTRNRSLVKSLPAGISSLSLASFTAISSLNMVGQPYGVLSGTHYQRDAKGHLIIGSDGWPLIADSQGVVGNPNPNWIAGFRNTFKYKEMSLTFLLDLRYGGDLWNGTKAYMDYLGVSKETGDKRDVTDYVFDGVTADGEVNTVAVDFADASQGLSGIKWRKAGTALGVAEDNIEDGSWIRLRDVTFTYRLPLKASVFENISLSVYGRNLFLITGYKGIDPETNLRGTSNAQGWDYFNLPGTKSYGVSLKAVIH